MKFKMELLLFVAALVGGIYMAKKSRQKGGK